MAAFIERPVRNQCQK